MNATDYIMVLNIDLVAPHNGDYVQSNLPLPLSLPDGLLYTDSYLPAVPSITESEIAYLYCVSKRPTNDSGLLTRTDGRFVPKAALMSTRLLSNLKTRSIRLI